MGVRIARFNINLPPEIGGGLPPPPPPQDPLDLVVVVVFRKFPQAPARRLRATLHNIRSLDLMLCFSEIGDGVVVRDLSFRSLSHRPALEGDIRESYPRFPGRLHASSSLVGLKPAVIGGKVSTHGVLSNCC